ncbi:unnamed protein product, partial [Prorocentrum cordatum]
RRAAAERAQRAFAREFDACAAGLSDQLVARGAPEIAGDEPPSLMRRLDEVLSEDVGSEQEMAGRVGELNAVASDLRAAGVGRSEASSAVWSGSEAPAPQGRAPPQAG